MCDEEALETRSQHRIAAQDLEIVRKPHISSNARDKPVAL
jgi:hypothetical protein